MDRDEGAIPQLLKDYPAVTVAAADLKNYSAALAVVHGFGPIHHLVNIAKIEGMPVKYCFEGIMSMIQAVTDTNAPNTTDGTTVVNMISVVSFQTFYLHAKPLVGLLKKRNSTA